jgi:hypothetical protein
LIALDYSACKIKWQINVTQIIVDFKPLPAPPDLTFVAASRTSPQVDAANNILYFGTLMHALMVAVDLRTGKILGYKQVNSHPFAVNTVSPTLFNGIIYTAGSSMEESAINVPGYKCCSFVGNAIALKFSRATGRFTTIWDVPMLPPDDPTQPGAWSGAAIWGSQPSIDASRRQVFYATGNVYSVPDAYLPCLSPNASLSSSKCLPDRVWQEAVLAIDLYSGRVNWVRHLGALDAWNGACFQNPVNTELCPGTPGVDADFGMAPAFVPGAGKDGRDVLVVGQKNGNLYSIDSASGAVQWTTVVGPGHSSGGLSWGVAVDGKNVYFTEINAGGVPWKPQPANDTVITNSAYGSASVLTGAILWETPVAKNSSSSFPPTLIGDLILTGRADPLAVGVGLSSSLVAVKKATGEIVMDFPLDSYSQAGISVQDKYIMLGSGYHTALDGSFYVLTVGT